MQLRYCTQEYVNTLKKTVNARIEWYYDPNSEALPEISDSIRNSKIAAPQLDDKLEYDTTNISISDAANALTVFNSLKDLTLHQASMEKVWVYLCHYDCPGYVSKRWLKTKPIGAEKQIKQIVNHFFATTSRALVRDNGISRLWWLGKIANEIDPSEPASFLKILLHQQDVRSSLLERPLFSRNPRLLKAIYEVMREHWKNNSELFERHCFRNFMRSLNRHGGVVLLDALPCSELMNLLRRQAENALNP